MKKLIPTLLLVGSLMLTGCGDSGDVNVISGQPVNPGQVVPNPPVPNPPVPNPPVPVTQGFFVDSVAGNDATGSFDTGSPFATVQTAVNVAPDGATIVVRPGNYAGPVALKNGQRLLGAGSALVTAQTTTRPILTGPVDMADGNTLDFLRIQGANGDAADGDGQNGGTVTNCEIVGATQRGVSAVPGTGNWTVTGNTITNSGALGVRLNTAGSGKMRARVNSNTITGSRLSAIGYLAEGSSELVAQTRENNLTGNQANFTFEAISGENAVMSLDIEANTNDDVYRFVRGDATATLNVEQFAQLAAINWSGRVAVSPISQPITDVANGFCGF